MGRKPLGGNLCHCHEVGDLWPFRPSALGSSEWKERVQWAEGEQGAASWRWEAPAAVTFSLPLRGTVSFMLGVDSITCL